MAQNIENGNVINVSLNLPRLGSRVRIPSPAPINPKEIQGLSPPGEKPGERQNTEHNRKLHANCAEARAKSAHHRASCSPDVLTAERLREVLRYDHETGVFAYLSRRCVKGFAGWPATRDGSYEINVDGRSYRASRLAWLYMTGSWPAGEIDYKNMDTADCSLSNLRLATRSQTLANRRLFSNNTTGFKGVYKTKSGRWQAAITVNGKCYHLGTFGTPEAAHAAYCEAAKKYFGEFARTE